MTDSKERAERWNEILPQLPGEMFMYYKDRLIEHLGEQLEVAIESRKQAEDKAFNAGIEAAAQACMREHLHEPQDEEDAAYDRGVDDCYKAVLRRSKPVQEPAERERGK